ncbi:hypothetical protein BH11BAC1_BH11BAC1_28330 [soil metagenome]
MENILVYLSISFVLIWIIGFSLSLGSVFYQYLLFGNSFVSKAMEFIHNISSIFHRS